MHSWKHDESCIETPNRLALFHLLRSDISCSISGANEHESNNIKSCPSNVCWHRWPASTSYLVLGPYHENMCMYMYTNVIYLHICMYINVDVSVLYPLFRLKVLQAGTVDVMNLKGLRCAPSALEMPNQPSTGSEGKSKADDAGLVSELLAPFPRGWRRCYNCFRRYSWREKCWETWKQTTVCFSALRKTKEAKINIRCSSNHWTLSGHFTKTFAYLVLGRKKGNFGPRHLTRSNWKAYGKPSAGVLQCIYYAHMGDKSIRMCVPRIALESGNAGVDFQDGKRTLLDLRFAADIILFAKMFEETQFFAGRTDDTFGPSGATIECTKNKNLNNPVSKSEQITSNRSVRRCLYTSMAGMHVHSQYQQSHFTFGISPPCCVESVFIAMQGRFKYFNAVTPVACFGAARRKVYKKDLCKMDIVFLRLLLSIVGPPGDLGILHHWHQRVEFS